MYRSYVLVAARPLQALVGSVGGIDGGVEVEAAAVAVDRYAGQVHQQRADHDLGGLSALLRDGERGGDGGVSGGR